MSDVAAGQISTESVRLEYLAKIRKQRALLCEPLASVEWRALPMMVRTVVVLLAGIDEGCEGKNFAEFTPPEQDAIKVQVRALKRSLAPLMALSQW